MKGAREYCKIFEKAEQIGRLYITPNNHARGYTFGIYVLPENEEVKENFGNAPLNKNAVEVYGVINGNLGWSESYGWLHKGKWQSDFTELYIERKKELTLKNEKIKLESIKKQKIEEEKKKELLNFYK